jgi:uncharacterized protein YukE
VIQGLGLAMPPGDPDELDQLAAQLTQAAGGMADLSASTRSVTSGVRDQAEWTGEAAESYSAFANGLGAGIAAAQAPLTRIANSVNGYAAALRQAQQQVANANLALQTAQDSASRLTPDAAAQASAANTAAQNASGYLTDLQAAGEAAAATIRTAGPELANIFGGRGPVHAWLTGREALSAERAEYQDGARLAQSLDKTGDYSGAAWLLAQHAGDPYFAAGLLNNLNAEQLIALMTWPNSAFPPPSTIDPAIVNAMADGTLSSAAMRRLVTWLTAMDANTASKMNVLYPLLQQIAKNPEASARLIAFINPAQPEGSAEMKDLLKIFEDTGADTSILQIMANAVSATSAQQSMALIKALVGDLSVLDSTTISQSSQALQAFMKASAAKLMPGIPTAQDLANPNALNDWFNGFSDNLSVLTPLLNEIGAAFQGHVDDVIFWRGFFEGVALSAAMALLPVSLPVGGAVALAATESAFTAELLPYLDDGVKYLFPAGEDGAQAQQGYWQNLQKIVVVAGVVRVYTAAGDKAGAEQLLKDPEFYKAVNTWVTFDGKRSTYDGWLAKEGVRLPGGQEYPLENMISQLADGVSPGTFQ